MRRFFTLFAASLLAMCALAQTQFTSGKFKYEVIEGSDNWVQIIPKSNSESGAGYSNLVTADFKTSVTYNDVTYTVVGIGANAFYRCKLNDQAILQLPEGYFFIDAGAFSYTEVGSLKLPATMQLIHERAFDNNKLAGVTVLSGNPYFAHLASTQGNVTYTMLTNKEKTKIIAAPGAKPTQFSSGGTTYLTSITIPEQITEIGDYAFYGNPTLKTVNFHAGITRIGMGAFYETQLTRVNIPNPDCEIGNSCFSNSQVSSITLPQGMKKLGRHVFFYCVNLTNLTLPEGMEEIGMMCFSSCNLTNVNLPSTMVKLDSCSLQDNPFTSIDLKNVKYVGRQAFSQCLNLTSVTSNGMLEEIDGAAFTRVPMTTAYLPEGLQTIIMNAYFRCTNLNSFTIPTTVTTITGNPCVGATSLHAFTVADGSPYFATHDGCLYATGGETVKPDQQRGEVDEPEGLTALVGVPTGWQQSLLHVPEGVTVIANQAAREAVSITEVELPSTLVEVRPSAFSGISDITRVTCLATTPPECSGESGNYFTDAVFQNATLQVPMRSVELYQNAAIWSNFQHIEGIDTGDDSDLLGDVNNDHLVNITDAIELINYILNDAGDINLEAANVNGDDEVNISDAIAIISYVLNDTW
ncbi:MAG: leucine-rich repeat protein [Muribaculaceae bacterium]|nr:leucine-rich repeat protein [Muribaculaceae bacterium]